MSHPLERDCPVCGAIAGQTCVGKRGHERKSFHRLRGSRRKLHAIYSTDFQTESPIEHAMVAAIEAWMDHHDIGNASIETQASIGPYRADILIEVGGRRLVVECDGAAFHTSPEQVERDKRRDRYCVGQGIAVMRFTGREITADARGCAAQVGVWFKGRPA